jgi:hypothetical protein
VEQYQIDQLSSEVLQDLPLKTIQTVYNKKQAYVRTSLIKKQKLKPKEVQ